MSAPLIGITTYRTRNRFGLPQICLNEAYISSLTEAGAVPVLVPLGLSQGNIDALIGRLDGLLFSGGGDVHPDSYGSQDHPLVENVDVDRDRVEIQLLQRTIEAKLPFLGICRGLQVINVGLGGGLYEDLLDQRPGSLRHQSSEGLKRDRLAHLVKIDEDSRLCEILGQGEVNVNSSHHQGIRTLAAGLKATAFATDGLIEAFELSGYPFGLAVQWHPEWLQAHAPMRALFRSFVQAADAGGN